MCLSDLGTHCDVQSSMDHEDLHFSLWVFCLVESCAHFSLNLNSRRLRGWITSSDVCRERTQRELVWTSDMGDISDVGDLWSWIVTEITYIPAPYIVVRALCKAAERLRPLSSKALLWAERWLSTFCFPQQPSGTELEASSLVPSFFGTRRCYTGCWERKCNSGLTSCESYEQQYQLSGHAMSACAIVAGLWWE